MFDVVTFGEAMIRLAPPHFERLEQANSLDLRIGGGELNVAVGVSRLGLRSTWVSRLPKNALGKLLENRVRQAGVDTSHLVWTDAGRVGLYFLEFRCCAKSQFSALRSVAVRHQRRTTWRDRLEKSVPGREVVPHQWHHAGAQRFGGRRYPRGLEGCKAGWSYREFRSELPWQALAA